MVPRLETAKRMASIFLVACLLFAVEFKDSLYELGVNGLNHKVYVADPRSELHIDTGAGTPGADYVQYHCCPVKK
jgi:hypothetical protein